MNSTEKQRLRNHLRALRQQLSPQEQQEKAKQLIQVVTHLPEFIQSHHIAAYAPFEGEIDPYPLLEKAYSMGKQCYLPVVHPRGFASLAFMEYKPGDPLVPNRFKILEPKHETQDLKKALSPEHLDLVLTPLVAFDEQGHRLGMGGGYYDHTFAFLNKNPVPTKPKLIGLAYELQGVKELPRDAWDIPLTGIATEKRYFVTQGKG